MANFGITINYVITNSQAAITSVSVGPAVGETADKNCRTSVSANGDINLDTGDTAVLEFVLSNDDNWVLSAVQLKDSDRSNFGVQPGGGKALDDDEEVDYPDIPQDTGTYMTSGDAPMRASFSDTNKKGKSVDYRVQFTNSTTGEVIYSDPRIRDSGGAN